MKVTRNRVTKAAGRHFARKWSIGLVAGCLVLAVTGGVAYGTSGGFGEHRVGQTYTKGLQLSSNQLLKPLGDRLVSPYGKFMGSTVSPDGRFLAATANDRSVSLQVFDLDSYQLIWRGGTADGVDAKLTDNTPPASPGSRSTTTAPSAVAARSRSRRWATTRR
jgi:hypothetical protein